MSFDGITNHARLACLDRHVHLRKREIRDAIKKGLVVIIPAKHGRTAYCHTVKKMVVISDSNLSTLMTFSPGGHFFRLIKRAREEIASGRVKRKEFGRETLFILVDGTQVYMNRRETRIRRIFPPTN